MEKNTIRLLNELHIPIPSVRNLIASMSGGQRQSVAVTRAVMWDCKIALLDEPTAALGVEQTRQVKNLILKLKERSLGVVVISHNLAEILDITDRIIVLRLGRRVATFDTKSILLAILLGLTIGAIQGFWIAKVHVPSFIVTLAGLLVWQGGLIYFIGESGTLNLRDPIITGIANTSLPVWAGWALGIISILTEA